MGHKHAQFMMEYAKDSLESDEAWKGWEFRVINDSDWCDLTDHPAWRSVCEYRRKPNQEDIDREAYIVWYNYICCGKVPSAAEGWKAALAWERSKK